eukprot:jgi/Hompol1/5743/HPOL_004667-RA
MSLTSKYGKPEETLGKGANATVKLLTHRAKGEIDKLYAIKLFRKRRKEETEKDYIKKVIAEFCISSSMHHENIVETVDLIQNEHGRWCEVMEYCAGGDLFHKTSQIGFSGDEEIYCIFRQLLNGVGFIHSIGVAHRDLKPENILLDASCQIIKITDFGTSAVFRTQWEKEPHKLHGVCGSAPYIAPEEWDEQQEYVPTKVDIWACGMIFYAMLSKSLLWAVAKPTDDHYANYLRRREAGYPQFERYPGGPCQILYSHIEGEMREISKISERSLYEQIVYTLDVLVPEDEDTQIFVPRDSYLQQVHYGHVHRWRVQRNAYRNLPEYLTDHRDMDQAYRVLTEKRGLFTPLDLGSPFLKKWDTLAFVLLMFTASVTPFETAFITGALQVDVLFLVNRFVDLIFFTDMFVQMRTPYRDKQTGKLVRDIKQIAFKYLSSWFPLDLVSVIPFELLGFMNSGSADLSQLRLLRFLRLTRLLKLLRVFRASRKLKQLQFNSGLRMGTLQVIKTLVVTIFMMHWLACGYRLAAERVSASDPLGWVDKYLIYENVTSIDVWDAYLLALYWSAATISLIGTSYPPLNPTNVNEWGYGMFAYIVAYLIAGYFIAGTANFLSQSTNVQMSQDILVDNYLEMFDTLKLDNRLKFKIIS